MSGATVRMHEQLVPLDIAALCGARIAPVADFDLPDHVAVHRITTWAGDTLPCSPAAAKLWDDAARGCLDAVSRALERLCRAHGGTHVEIDLANGTRSWQHVAPPTRLPVLRRCAAQRSAAAQRAFVAEVDAATAAHRPVYDRIAGLLEQSRGARLRRVQVAQEVARRRCWVVRDEEGVPHVERVRGGDSATALTAAELDRTLAALQRAGAAAPAWDPGARAELERECAAAGVEIGFGQWWDLVTEGRWRRPQSVQHVQHATGHHSSYGAGGHSTFGAGF